MFYIALLVYKSLVNQNYDVINEVYVGNTIEYPVIYCCTYPFAFVFVQSLYKK